MSAIATAQQTNPSEPLLEIRGLTKRFHDVPVVDGVDLDVLRGEIHAFLGQNGAGKSTLIKMLAGVYTADGGELSFEGQPWDLSAVDRLPIAFIHQELGLVGSLTVAENVALVAGYPRRSGLISWRAARREARRVLATLGTDVDPDRLVSELSIAERSMVAIARALARQAKVVVLDEPTATLPAHDVNRLFAVLERLREHGVGLLYVTHRLDEVFRLADRVTVLRDGRRVLSAPVSEITVEQLVLNIVGRPLKDVFVSPPVPSGVSRLEVDGLEGRGAGPVSLRLAQGEILGLVGLRGGGQEVVGRMLFGDLEATAGSVRVDGETVNLGDVKDAMNASIGFLTSNRADEAIAPELTVRENMFLHPPTTRAPWKSMIRRGDERSRCSDVLDRFDVRPRDTERPMTTLSGGNQQKVVLARWLEQGSEVLILEEPTTGVDVGAKADIYAMLGLSLAQGHGVLLISSDFEEIALVCHRALVFNRGSVVAEVGKEELTVERLTALASGATDPTERDGEEARVH